MKKLIAILCLIVLAFCAQYATACPQPVAAIQCAPAIAMRAICAPVMAVRTIQTVAVPVCVQQLATVQVVQPQAVYMPPPVIVQQPVIMQAVPVCQPLMVAAPVQTVAYATPVCATLTACRKGPIARLGEAIAVRHEEHVQAREARRAVKLATISTVVVAAPQVQFAPQPGPTLAAPGPCK